MSTTFRTKGKGKNRKVYPVTPKKGRRLRKPKMPTTSDVNTPKTITCGQCGKKHTVYHDKWSALGCPCGAELHKTKTGIRTHPSKTQI